MSACNLTIQDFNKEIYDVCKDICGCGKPIRVHPQRVQRQPIVLFKPHCDASKITSEIIRSNQLDDRYYSPCCNLFVLKILSQLYNPPYQNINDCVFLESAKNLMSDYHSCLHGSDALGYCSQDYMDDIGITALLAADFGACMSQLSVHKGQDTSDMIYCHQAQLIQSRGFMDITCFTRIQAGECDALNGNKCLYPLSFIEVIEDDSNTIHERIPQASIYANGNFSLMKYDKYHFWVPLLGMIMSETTIQFRMYYLTIVNECWKIAEIALIEFPFCLENVITSISAMHYWNTEARTFLLSQPNHLEVPESLLFPTVQQNVYIDQVDKVVYKAYDYRTISGKSNIDPAERRSPTFYSFSKLKNVGYFIQYESPVAPTDEFIVLKYDYVDGTHVPQKVVQLVQILQEIMGLHEKGLVYGDLKLSNCVFNCLDGVYNSILIDFDFVGLQSKRRYPSTFNTAIDPSDGKRHETAKPMRPLKKEHDVFAFHYICSLFEVETTQIVQSAHWNQALLYLEAYDCDYAFEQLQLCKDLDLRPKATSDGNTL